MHEGSYVVIACGCITLEYGYVQQLGSRDKEQLCPKEHGWQKILREATIYERVRFHFDGIPASKRRSSKAPDWVRAMSGSDNTKASRSRPEDGLLF
jgi:hypothetical protein